MSTASQRRKAKRLALQAPFAEKVREVALALPRRRPEPANGMLYVERIESGPLGDGLAHPLRIVDLNKATGGKPHRRFVIQYGEQQGRSMSATFDPRCLPVRYLEFTWRSWAVRAGDTEVRWFTPELIGAGATEQGARAFGAARKAAAYVSMAIGALGMSPGGSWLARDLSEAREALLEFLAKDDPDSTRADREARTNAEARAQ